MIVELDKQPKAWGTMVGGTSGNTGSPYSKTFVNEWKSGGYHKMYLFKNKKEALRKNQYSWNAHK